MKEIGGYLELEEFSGKEYYHDLTPLNLGRAALVCLCRARGFTKLWLPYFICDSVIAACEDAGISLSYYHVDRQLVPLLPETLPSDDYLYLVNYYGQLTDASILDYKKKYDRIIVDHTHAFFQKPITGIDTLYSCRKFFGLPDGAYLSTDASLPSLPDDRSSERMGHLLGRYEEDASSYYCTMLANAETFYGEPPKSMSRLTRNLLKGVDYHRTKARRNANFQYLDDALHLYHPPFFHLTDGPLAYVIYHPQGMRLRKALASKKIYVPTYWGNVLKEMPRESTEYDFASNLLPLPCDQRYTSSEMKVLISFVMYTIKDLENIK